jgi:hypothetical protein
VDGTQESLWSNLGMLLAEHNMSVLALHKRLQEKGVSVNLKSLYRLAALQPLQKFDARIVKPICLVLGIDLSELISLEKPELNLLKLDPIIWRVILKRLDTPISATRGTVMAAGAPTAKCSNSFGFIRIWPHRRGALLSRSTPPSARRSGSWTPRR